MYSFEPMNSIAPSLYAILALLSFFGVAILCIVFQSIEGKRPRIVVSVVYILIILTSIFCISRVDPPINTSVEATLKEFSYEEGFRSSGKRSMIPTLHVIYILPDGNEVSFIRGQGLVYPKRAILYYNPER